MQQLVRPLRDQPRSSASTPGLHHTTDHDTRIHWPRHDRHTNHSPHPRSGHGHVPRGTRTVGTGTPTEILTAPSLNPRTPITTTTTLRPRGRGGPPLPPLGPEGVEGCMSLWGCLSVCVWEGPRCTIVGTCDAPPLHDHTEAGTTDHGRGTPRSRERRRPASSLTRPREHNATNLTPRRDATR